jgi:uncharacterized phage protein (TIGR01671 family)
MSSPMPLDVIVKSAAMNPSESDWWNEEKLEIMQFTGLRDKNGKEIYEGDVIVYCQHPECTGREPFHLRHAYEVRWKTSMNRVGWNIGDNGNHIVIGNIYENPELLV